MLPSSISSTWLLLGVSLGFWSFVNAVAPHKPTIPTSVVDEWVQCKCGSNQQLWKYQGSLYDPLDGRRVATVHGLELVSRLQHRNETSDLEIYRQVLNNPNSTFHRAATLWSQNIFCYTIDEGKEMLRNIKVRPYSPEKRIPLDQSVAVYETATTYIERTQGSGEMLIHSEWASPKNRNKTISLWSETSPLKKEEGLGFSVYAKLRHRKSPLFLPDLSRAANEEAARKSTNDTMVISPKRSSWIQFGLSNMESKHKFGARESYSMTASPTTNQQKRRLWPRRLPWQTGPADIAPPRLTYSRYGEGPPFYAPGRMCMLELEAEPIGSLEEAPLVLQTLIRDKVSGWNQASFQGIGAISNPLMLVPLEEDVENDVLTRARGYVLQAWDRARPVTRLVSIFQNEKRFW